jgi:hypothetical protein
VTRDLALSLLRAGHHIVVYSPLLGPISDELRRNSICVTSDISSINQQFDIIHAHHNPVATVAIARFPNTPALFVSHDFLAWYDVPPRFPSIRRYVAVDETVAERLTGECGIPQRLLRIVLNAVDTTRFQPGPPLPQRPTRALVFAKNVGHLGAIEEACRSRGIETEVIGTAVGRTSQTPERFLSEHHIVFASALRCLEALACGRSVIVCDGRGLAGIVTEENLSDWRRSNFGLRLLRNPVTAEAVRSHIDRYDPVAAAAVSERIRAQANTDVWASTWTELYREILSESAAALKVDSLFPIAMGQHLQNWGPRVNTAWPWMEERSRLIAERDKAMFGGSYQLGQPILFGRATVPEWALIYGFSQPEEWGVWTEGSEACFLIALPEPPLFDLSLDLVTMPFVHRLHPCIDFSISANGCLIGEWRFEYPLSDERQHLTMTIPIDVLRGRRFLCVTLRIRTPASPKEAGISADTRLLGLGLISALVRPLGFAN